MSRFPALVLACSCAAASVLAAQQTETTSADTPATAIAPKAGSSLSSQGAGLSAQGSSLTGSTSGLGAYETELGTAVSLAADVLFQFDSAELKPAAIPQLQQLADLIQQKKPKQVQIHGHTDAMGSEAYNLKLSQRRADAVAAWLTGKGVGRDRLATKGFGERNPVAPNQLPDGSDDPAGRQKNRRVDILLAKAFASITPIRPKQ